MKLELLETDSLSNKGVAKNIVVSIDGRRIILPIKTTLAGLLALAQKEDLKALPIEMSAISPVIAPQPQIQPINEGIIEREDIVRCVRVLERAQGADVDIRMGGEYRVLGMKKIVSGGQTVVEYYEVVDDNAPVPRRVMVSPVEVVLLRKHTPGPKKVLVYEEMFTCECGEPNGLILDQKLNKYTGKCKCGKEMVCERSTKENSRT